MSQIRSAYHDLRRASLPNSNSVQPSHASRRTPRWSFGRSLGAGTFRRLLLSVFLVIGFGYAARAALTVDTTLDGDDGECVEDCTLREAVATAGPGEVIAVPAGRYDVSLGAIAIDRNLTIVGEGAQHTVIVGNSPPRRVFTVEARASVGISDLSISRDPATTSGGGIRNDGALTLTGCWLRDALNPLDTGGGALRNTVTGTLTVERCTISDNSSEFAGAALNEGVMTIESSTITGNSNAFFAGGLINSGGELTVSDSTIVGNIAALQGAGNVDNFGTFVVSNTVIADGVGGPDCEGVIDATAGHNLDSDGTCIASGGTGNLTAPPNLGELTDNGGPVPTRAPAADSAVIDAGNACSATDARGVARPQGASCDIGAVELALGQSCAGGSADDADGDGVCRVDDNCPAGFKPGQGAVVFPHTLVASAVDRFSWAEPEDISFVRGDLDQVDVLGTNDAGDLTGTDTLVDADVPAPDSGFFYIVRLGGDCTGAASWQTRPGGEAARDQTLP